MSATPRNGAPRCSGEERQRRQLISRLSSFLVSNSNLLFVTLHAINQNHEQSTGSEECSALFVGQESSTESRSNWSSFSFPILIPYSPTRQPIGAIKKTHWQPFCPRAARSTFPASPRVISRASATPAPESPPTPLSQLLLCGFCCHLTTSSPHATGHPERIRFFRAAEASVFLAINATRVTAALCVHRRQQTAGGSRVDQPCLAAAPSPRPPILSRCSNYLDPLRG